MMMMNQAICFHTIDERDSCMDGPDLTLELRDFRLLQAVAAEGSLARASLRLHLTPSALSHHLLALESRVGTPLCQRAGRRMGLTPAGVRLAEAGARVLAAVAEAERAVAGAEPARAVLRLATECHTTYYWLPSVIAAYERVDSTVEVRLASGNGASPLADVIAGEVDVAIVSGRTRDRRLRFVPIFRDELVALVSPDHPWARRTSVDAADFASEHLIHYATTKSELTVFRVLLRPAGVQPRRQSPVLLTEAILEMVKSGLGVAVLAHWAAAPYVERGHVRAVRLTGRGLRRQWYAAMRAGVARTASARHLVAALRSPGIFKIRTRR
jgi:LysR family transcriptional regulator for metE and metH